MGNLHGVNVSDEATPAEDVAYLRAQLDLLWRLQNKAAMKREERVKWLEQNDFKPNYTYLTLMCGCRRFRDDSKMPCHRHAGEPQAHPVMPNGKTLAEMADTAIEADKRTA